ncbi:large ribosomal subunit protein bL31c [Apium graveolens]|uniref:large ribosomal subunit protein bL31c n=1 Tax=Apium graveolens TaxID=4045 RepID=UPI003D792DEC
MSLSLSNTFLQANLPLLSSSLKKEVFQTRPYTPRWTCRKPDIHPKFYDDAKVYCNGQLVMTTGGTKQEYVVDVWSGNHPFYQGSRSALLLDDDQVEKFRKKFSGLDQIMTIPDLKGEIILPPKRKSGAGKGKKK